MCVCVCSQSCATYICVYVCYDVKFLPCVCAEKDAADACVWLRAAGFPQYVQMYEGTQFELHPYTHTNIHAYTLSVYVPQTT